MQTRRLIGIGLILLAILTAVMFPVPPADPAVGRPITDFWYFILAILGFALLIWPAARKK